MSLRVRQRPCRDMSLGYDFMDGEANASLMYINGGTSSVSMFL